MKLLKAGDVITRFNLVTSKDISEPSRTLDDAIRDFGRATRTKLFKRSTVERNYVVVEAGYSGNKNICSCNLSVHWRVKLRALSFNGSYDMNAEIIEATQNTGLASDLGEFIFVSKMIPYFIREKDNVRGKNIFTFRVE